MPTVLFRCDASPQIGGGHVMRCLSLATALAATGWNILFAARSGSAATVPGLAKVACIDLDADDDAAELEASLAGRKIDLLVVDSYRLGAAYETACRAFAARILAIDDLADRAHDCDFLLDQTLGRAASDYAKLVSPDCRLLLGTDYALLRPAFAAARAASLEGRAHRKAARALVSFGASDPHGLAPRVAAALLAANADIVLDVVPDRAGRDECARLAERYTSRLQVHFAVEAIEQLMAAADIAVGAAGTMSWERCAMGLPSVVVVTADNQRLIARRLEASGAARHVSLANDAEVADLVATTCGLLGDPTGLAAMSQRAADICDGRGAKRTLLALPGPYPDRTGRMVRLRAFEMRDMQTVFDWQGLPGIRRWSRTPTAPSWSEHSSWVARAMAATDAHVAIVERAGESAGLLQLRPVAQPDAAADGIADVEVSILVPPPHQGFGVAGCALQLARVALPEMRLLAHISPANAGSRALFRAAGYIAVDAENHVSAPPYAAAAVGEILRSDANRQ
jgi:UDP-2,4-diacetamido-2,4,6-trideoxy-beta-L-altropyranose hydrolase